jgi:hypothetical protein
LTPEQTKLKELTTFLSEQGIDLENLMFASAGSEQVIGQYVETTSEGTLLLNPLRFFRVQRLTQGGSMEVQFMVGTYDMMNEGSLFIRPQAHFMLRDQPVETQLSYGALLAQYIDARRQNQARSAGLVLPQSVVPPR